MLIFPIENLLPFFDILDCYIMGQPTFNYFFWVLFLYKQYHHMLILIFNIHVLSFAL